MLGFKAYSGLVKGNGCPASYLGKQLSKPSSNRIHGRTDEIGRIDISNWLIQNRVQKNLLRGGIH